MNFALQTNKIFEILEIEDKDAPINDEKRNKVKDLITKVYYLGVSSGANNAFNASIAAIKEKQDEQS